MRKERSPEDPRSQRKSSPRNRVIQVRLEETGYQFVCAIAKELGMTPSGFVREVIYKDITTAAYGAANRIDSMRPGIIRQRTREIVLQRYKYQGKRSKR